MHKRKRANITDQRGKGTEKKKTLTKQTLVYLMIFIVLFIYFGGIEVRRCISIIQKK